MRQEKVTNVLVLCGGVAFYWCNIFNVSDRNTAVWMHDPVRRVLQDIRQECRRWQRSTRMTTMRRLSLSSFA